VAFGGGLQVNGAVMDSHRLAGISDDSYNLVGLYEKGPIAMRLAYSWRSSFLTNNLDCCIGLPIYQKGAGFLDGSIRYQVNNNIEVSLDGSNLLNTTTVFQQQVFGDSGDAGRQAGEDRLVVDPQRPPRPIRHPLQVLVPIGVAPRDFPRRRRFRRNGRHTIMQTDGTAPAPVKVVIVGGGTAGWMCAAGPGAAAGPGGL
jgi:hypothetical protein